ncbi:hypothetical protein DPMN_017835 [Dreissena polymorpha]|uniref:Uncharacterized protein n=1 Tax=Dreissena polymorpha TaxID=45954 RepID=A0A9D4S7Q7_DREPO|nr:hypothetical protein DPMN_017835 [Dreissena polymorpha]
MIPERNLMTDCGLEYEQQLTWIATLNEMMKEGPRIILRLPKIRQTILAHPEPLRWYSSRTKEMEMLELIDMNRRTIDMDIEKDVIMQATLRRQLEIVLDVSQRMIMKGGR